MRHINASLQTAFAFTAVVLALAVFLNGVHGKDVVSAGRYEIAKRADDAVPHKVLGELHHHSDNSVKIQHSDGHQADNRSLRLLHHRKHHIFSQKMADRIRNLWQAARV